jgi:hypothetical protein
MNELTKEISKKSKVNALTMLILASYAEDNFDKINRKE